MPGTGKSAAAVQAIRALPQQQQLLLCAAMRLLGAPAPDSPGPSGGFGTPCRVAQVWACTAHSIQCAVDMHSPAAATMPVPMHLGEQWQLRVGQELLGTQACPCGLN